MSKKIKMRTTAASAAGILHAGTVYQVDDKIADVFLSPNAKEGGVVHADLAERDTPARLPHHAEESKPESK